MRIPDIAMNIIRRVESHVDGVEYMFMLSFFACNLRNAKKGTKRAIA